MLTLSQEQQTQVGMNHRIEKPVLLPVHFTAEPDEDFNKQIAVLHRLLGDEAEFLPPVPVGASIPDSADAVVLPEVLGAAYRNMPQLKAISVPLLIITSEFGTVSMWDWEVAARMRSEGIGSLAPSNLDQATKMCRALGVKRQLRHSKFLVFQDNPGAGFQANIFKRFYWWEDECTRRICDKFGIQIVRKSFKELGEGARAISDREAQAAADARTIATQGVSSRAMLNAFKIYLAVRRELDADLAFEAVGINCLNESHFSDTTPCLAWNLLYEEDKLIWGCEADTMSMLTKLIVHRSLGVPIMMSNVYPFIMGQAALKHERIPLFPQVREPENCILVAHCGYFGVVPQSFCSAWTLRPKVLAIVNDAATAIDARLPEGPVTLVKLHPKLDLMSVAEGCLESYAQFEDSDCLNGAVIRVKDGPAFVRSLASHHYLITTGHNQSDIRMLGGIFDFAMESL
jgi:hypothetical protein